MRKELNFNSNWLFTKSDGEFIEPSSDDSQWDPITLPHTWNVEDGQTACKYHRGRCWYHKRWEKPDLEPGQHAVLKFEAVEHIAEVFCNGRLLTTHKGGYSTFFVDLTENLIDGENLVAVCADNLAEHIYPQFADFTFFGGIYRPVTLLILDENHFSLEKSGSDGIFITPKVDGTVRVEAFATGGNLVSVSVSDKMGNLVAEGNSHLMEGKADFTIQVANPHRWQGVKDPYLYTAKVMLDDSDELSINFGFREYQVDPEKGFFLNGISTPLRGVSRHQCRENMGTAISWKEHAEDVSLILETGSNSVRLAHYQHAQAFYDLCDATGLVAWAEIPFISRFDPSKESYENTISQMTELIMQNYNHASICFWGIGNELGIGGETDDLIENLRCLNELCHKLDPNRLTTIANLGMAKPDSALCFITDVIGYNQYLGWYQGKIEEFAPWMDQTHAAVPNRCMAISEYGAEAVMGWHSDTPHVRDYTEEYQALVHEGVMKAISERPYLWATYVWNMFDFAAANRDEGGSKGRNNKGLATFNRKIKKDSFFLYKAYLSDKPFVYITGRRYVQRPHETITVKIYSNCPQVTLCVNGAQSITQSGDKVFLFDNIPLQMGKNTLFATANDGITDLVEWERVAEPNLDYVLPESKEEINEKVMQWFADLVPQNTELQFPEGYCSINDEIGYLMSVPEARAALEDLLLKPLSQNMGPGMNQMFDINTVLPMVKQLRLVDLFSFVSNQLPEKVILLINEKLNTIKKA